MRRNGEKGLFIVFEGTDGSGKTTIIEGIANLLAEIPIKGHISYYHWRPGFIKSPNPRSNGNNNVCSQPHAKPPYNRFISVFKFLFFNLDYIFGYLFKVKKEINKGNLVVFDRYYYDYYLDKRRYRLNISDRIIDFFKPLIPKPNATFLLIGNPLILYERKKEIPVEEIENQIGLLKEKKIKFFNPIIINVDNDVSTVIKDVMTEIKKIKEMQK